MPKKAWANDKKFNVFLERGCALLEAVFYVGNRELSELYRLRRYNLYGTIYTTYGRRTIT